MLKYEHETMYQNIQVRSIIFYNNIKCKYKCNNIKICRWWVRNVGTVPIKRRSDHGGKADNTEAMAKLYEALQAGDMVCVFPEGVSRYQSGLAPLRPGVGRIVLEVRCGNVGIYVYIRLVFFSIV